MTRSSSLLRPPFRFPLVDALLIFGVVGLAFAVIDVEHEWVAPLRPSIDIDLSPWSLPGYAVLSLARGLAAYLISLAFTLVYGYWAARHRPSERVLIPLLDILQSIPVLGFMPGLVLGLIAIFPTSNVGLELAAVLMIFTGQAWNMTFSFHRSLTALPKDQVEAAAVFRFSWWQRVRWVELPASVTGLVWNSMMSMAGGWFFLMVSESFVLGTRDFRLPGLGSYMSVALERADWTAMAWGVAAMVAMIVVLDQVLWRPLVVWAERFRVEDTAAATVNRSWMLDLLRRSRVARRWQQWRHRRAVKRRLALRTVTPTAAPPPQIAAPAVRSWGTGAAWGACALLVAGLGWGALSAGALLTQVPFAPSPGATQVSWLELVADTGLTAARVLGALVLGSLWAVPAGIAIGGSPTWSRRLQPVVQVAASFPAPMLFPLCLMAFHALGLPLGIGSMVLMLLGTQWYILFNVIAGSQAIPSELRECSVAFRMSRWRRFWSLDVPAVLPTLVTGWITAAGGAWNASIVAEYLSWRGEIHTTTGLGSAISRAAERADYPTLAAAVALMVVVVVVLNATIWKRLGAWARSRFAIGT